MRNIITIHHDTRKATRKIEKLLKKVHNPSKLLQQVQRYVGHVTRQMFTGKRADTSGGKRGIQWKKLEKSTIKKKRYALKKGKLTGTKNPRRAMIYSGDLKFSHKVLRSFKRGFVYGSLTRSKKGFDYPGYHNQNNFPWLFLTKKDRIQMTSMIKDFLKDKLEGIKTYKQYG